MSSRTIEIIINAVNKASPAIESVGGSLQNLGKVALAGVAGVATATAAIGAALTKLAVDAAPMEGVSRAFEGLAESSGVGMDEMLAALKRGSAGMISNRDLMTSFNKAAQLVSTDFAVQLPNAMGYLGKVAAATGQDMNFMLDSLVTGVGRLSPMILDNLGIQVSLTEANEAYAASIGKRIRTDQERAASRADESGDGETGGQYRQYAGHHHELRRDDGTTQGHVSKRARRTRSGPIASVEHAHGRVWRTGKRGAARAGAIV